MYHLYRKKLRMDSLKDATDYKTDFDTEWYVDNLYRKLETGDVKGIFVKFILDSFTEAFATGKVKGDRLLDIGTGPSIHTVISASRHVNNIDLSDYAPQNRAYLTKWMNGKVDLQNELFQHIMDSEKDGGKVEDRNAEIKSKVRNIYSIDVLRDEVFIDAEPPLPYDVITSSLCLDSATKTIAEYTKAFANVTKFLKIGGYLVLTGGILTSFYVVGDFKFPCAKISEKQLRDIYTEAGFEIQMWKKFTMGDEHVTEGSDLAGAFGMLAKKIK